MRLRSKITHFKCFCIILGVHNLRNLLRNFIYFLFLSNQIANLKSYAVNYAFQMFLRNAA